MTDQTNDGWIIARYHKLVTGFVERAAASALHPRMHRASASHHQPSQQIWHTRQVKAGHYPYI
jgi:hypothetical protein